MKKNLLIGLGVAVGVLTALAVLSLYAAQRSMDSTDTNTPPVTQKPSEKEEPEGDICPAIAAAGRYVDYREELVVKKCSGYGHTVLFFHASWCPECRGFEQAIEAGEVPAGVQILKVDYDSSGELRKKHGVTIQSTFVRVDESGNTVTKWTGYGKEKSIAAIIENTQ